MAAEAGRSLFVIGILTKIHLSQAKEYCEDDYYCETGHCCADKKCCTYYYELWWFWVIWVVVAIIGLCCFYQQRRRKLRRQRCHLQRRQYQSQHIARPAIHNNTQGSAELSAELPRPVFDAEKLFHLPTYDEAQEQEGLPPSYSSLYATTLPQTVIGQPEASSPGQEDNVHGAQTVANAIPVVSQNVPQPPVAAQFSRHAPNHVLPGTTVPTTIHPVNTGTAITLESADAVKPAEQGRQVEALDPLGIMSVELDDSMTACLLDNTEDQPEFLGRLQIMSPTAARTTH